jgi:phosphate starvation-inducible PhoH-like protein
MTTRRKTKNQEQASFQKIKIVEGKTENQNSYIRAIIENDVIFCSGPSGCGKSYIASGIASEHLYRGAVDQIIITRPIICTGKDIGSLPGDVLEKIGPYLIPMQENFRFFLGQTFYGLYVAERKIRYEPLEMMRGSTFNNSYLILDEAQNCTYDQIKMFITRMGKNSKVLINGDVNQTDLKAKSGLWSCMDKLKSVQGVSVITLDRSDIQRNGMIGKILDALES